LAIEAISEVAVVVAEDEVDGMMTVVIEVGRLSVIIEGPEMIEAIHPFATIGVMIVTVGIGMTALEVAEHLHLKAALVHLVMELAIPEIYHRRRISTALGEAPGTDRLQVALPLPILCNLPALVVVMDEAEEAVAAEEETSTMTTFHASHRLIQTLAVEIRNPLPHLHLKFLPLARLHQICRFHQRFRKDLRQKFPIKY
jgi:hypothetical protein